MAEELKRAWEMLERSIPFGTPLADIDRIRTAFYAGAYAVFEQMNDRKTPQEIAAGVLAGMRDEVLSFLGEIRVEPRTKDQPYTSPQRRSARK